MSTSPVEALLRQHSNLRVQTYFKASLTALSHAMEDWALAATEPVLIVANFQQERFYRQEASRYQRLARHHRVYVLCARETRFVDNADPQAVVTERSERVAPFNPDDPLAQEWHVAVLGPNYASCLICRERGDLSVTNTLDSARAFEGIWSSDRAITVTAARLLLERVAAYRPDLDSEIDRICAEYCQQPAPTTAAIAEMSATPQPFVDRLVTHLQAGQYKLLNAYRSLAAKETRERLLAETAAAIRRSLDPQDVLQAAAEQIGRHLQADRAIGYRYRDGEAAATVVGEFCARDSLTSLRGRSWLYWEKPLGQALLLQREPLAIDEPSQDPQTQDLTDAIASAAIARWLLVPIAARDRLLGVIEVHRCLPDAAKPWSAETVATVAAVAAQVGVALTQAEAYARLEDLNEQLAALDRTRSNLVAIAGHELRTPLSTIQVCLESLASEPEMSVELRQVMLNTALVDAERMRRLIRDFLTLSQFESGRVDWNPEAVSLEECIELSLSNLRARWRGETLPEIVAPAALERTLTLVRVDGEWLVEVLAKLLDNACKFTAVEGRVAIEVDTREDGSAIAVSVADTGRGVEPTELERIFERFYQEEGALQRTRNGTGLGLAICRQVVERWGGHIWAESDGRDRGTRISFTVPSAAGQPAT